MDAPIPTMTDIPSSSTAEPAPPSADHVRSVLAGVLDPELHASIVDLGMVGTSPSGPAARSS